MQLDTRLQNVFRDVFDDDTMTLTPEVSQKTHADWDSFQQVKLIIALEEEFDAKFSTEEAISLTSVAEIRAWLVQRGLGA